MDIASIPDIVAWHFAWKPNEDAPFDPATDNREDEVIIECNVEQSQDGFAMGSMKVVNPRIGLYNGARKQWAYLSATIYDPTVGALQVVPWFKFYLEAWPSQGDGVFVELSLKAMPSDWLVRQEAVLAEARVGPWYDDAFVGSRDPVSEPEVNLEGRPALVDCNPLSHEARLVSVLDAGDELDIGEAWIGDSLSINDGSKDALDAVTVECSARWRQPISAVFAVSPTGLTYTPSPLWKARIKKGVAIDGSYKLLGADFAFYQEEAPGTGLSIEASPVNGMIDDVGVPGGSSGQAHIARWSFFMNYQVGVSYEIQREETYRMTVAWNGQKTNRVNGPARSETISLQISMDDASNVKRWRPFQERHIGDLRVYAGLAYRAPKARDEGLATFLEELEYNDPDTGTADPYWVRYAIENDIRYASSFFSTGRGELAIQHMAMVAHARLAVSRSSYVTSFDLIKPALGLQVSCAMMLRASSVPIGGDDEIYGKVSKWKLTIAEGGTARFSVDISSVPGSGTDIEEGAGTGEAPTQEILVAQEGAINNDGAFVQFQGKDWAGIYAPFKTDYPADRPTWWPINRSWPPNLAEDTLGLYTHGRSMRFDDGSSQIYVQPGNTAALDAIADPYGAIFPADAPAWWPVISSPFAAPSPGNPVTGVFPNDGELAFAWPPGSAPVITGTSYYHSNSDPFQYHIVPPENDELDGSGGIPVPVGDDLEGYNFIPASDQPWDKVAIKQTVIPYIPPAPLDYFALPRVAQAEDAPEYGVGEIIPGGIEIRRQAPEQAFILTHRDHPHWAKMLSEYGENYDPFDDSPGVPPLLPGDDGFDPQKALEVIETEIVLHLKPVQGISSSIAFEAVGKWNGPKHVDTGAGQS